MGNCVHQAAVAAPPIGIKKLNTTGNSTCNTRTGAAAPAAASIPISSDDTSLISKSSESTKCSHANVWEPSPGLFQCCTCLFTSFDETRVQVELNHKARINAEDHSSPEDAVNRGVTLQFLYEFCSKHALWEVPTCQVRDQIILEATRITRDRYVDLPSLQEIGVVGRAHTFVSHCWGAPFGLIVAALLEGDPDMNRRVWIDIFAVRQWPCVRPDLDFRGVIRQCPSFVLVSTSEAEVTKIPWDSLQGSHDVSFLSEDVFRRIPFLRVWCLVEIYAALSTPGMVITMKVGALKLKEGAIGGYGLHRKDAWMFLSNLFKLIDVRNAKATVESDRVRILQEIDVNAVNSAARGLFIATRSGSSEDASIRAVVACAAMGDAEPLSRLIRETDVAMRGKYLRICAMSGYTALLQELLSEFPHAAQDASSILVAAEGGHADCVGLLIGHQLDVNCADKEGVTPCIAAARGGHVECMRLLLSAGCNVDAVHKDGWTACMNAARGGSVECLRLLLDAGCNVDAVNKDGRTACQWAAQNGHLECLQLLLTKDCNVDVVDCDGRTACINAAGSGHADCLKLLLEANCSRVCRDSEGRTALELARARGFVDCVALLS